MADTPFRVTHDPEADAAYIYLAGPIAPGSIAQTTPIGRRINLDFDAQGRLLGIELLTASLLHPDLLALAVPPGTGPPG